MAAEGLGSLAGALVIASRRGFIPHRRIFAAAVLVTPLLLIVFAGSRWRWPCVVLLVLIGAAESGFATMQSTLVLLSAHEDRRGGAMGILSACIGTQPLGTLWLGLLATGIGVAAAIALNSLARARGDRAGGGGAVAARSARRVAMSATIFTPGKSASTGGGLWYAETDGQAALGSQQAPDLTDFPTEKPLVARAYCPGCEPGADPLREILDVHWCDAHMPCRAGPDDVLATAQGTAYGGAEAGGDDNRRWCALIHRETSDRRRRASAGRSVHGLDGDVPSESDRGDQRDRDD